MKLSGKKDLRVVKTLEAIRKSFEELLCEKDFLEITVTELCERARISKKTFYCHYASIDELLDELQEDLLISYIEKVKDFRIPEEMNKVNRVFFEFSCSQGKVYERINSATGSFSYIRQQLAGRVVTETWMNSETFGKLDEFKRDVLVEFMKSVSLTIYLRWLADGKKEPVEKLIELADALTYEGMNGLFNLP